MGEVGRGLIEGRGCGGVGGDKGGWGDGQVEGVGEVGRGLIEGRGCGGVGGD